MVAVGTSRGLLNLAIVIFKDFQVVEFHCIFAEISTDFMFIENLEGFEVDLEGFQENEIQQLQLCD